jgi:hypothetical protein
LRRAGTLVQKIGAQQLEQFVHQWANSFHRLQISKKDFPPNFKEHALVMMSSWPISDIDLCKFWTHTFPNKSVVMSCNVAVGDYSVSPE